MYRVVNINSGEVLSLDEIASYGEAVDVGEEIEGHESAPEVEIQFLVEGEWVKVAQFLMPKTEKEGEES